MIPSSSRICIQISFNTLHYQTDIFRFCLSTTISESLYSVLGSYICPISALYFDVIWLAGLVFPLYSNWFSQPCVSLTEDRQTALDAAGHVKVTYKDVKTPILTIAEATKAGSFFPSKPGIKRGDAESEYQVYLLSF